MTVVYGISNCDTVKKARAWFAAYGVAYDFYDFKKQGVPKDRLLAWASAVGWDKLINRSGTTWRQLDTAAQASAQMPDGAMAVALANPSVIKRPVIEWGAGALKERSKDTITVGFDEQRWRELLAK